MANNTTILVLVILLLTVKETWTQSLVSITVPSSTTAAAAAASKEKESTSESCSSSSGLSLNFQNAGLRRIDSDFADSPNVSCLSLASNEIEHVSPTAFRLMPKLHYLNLARNSLDLADLSLLAGHSRLNTLILDHQNTSSSSSSSGGGTTLDLENHFPRLTRLHLSDSNIVAVKSLAFAPRLRHLYLGSNNLPNVSFLAQVASSIELLDLTASHVSSLDAGGLASLLELRLDDNRIGRVCAKACPGAALVLGGAKALRRLSLARNEITSLEPDALEDARHLEGLDLSYNRLDVVRKDSFEHADELKNLTLAANLLSYVPDLAELGELEHLSLAGNMIESVANESFARSVKLRSLDLSGNRIASVDAGAFEKLVLLETLNLSGNKIKSFPNLWLLQMMSLRRLLVDNNEIERLDELKLAGVRMSAKLERVYLRNNSISQLRLNSFYNAFRPLPNVTLVFFDDEAAASSDVAVLLKEQHCKCNCYNNESKELTSESVGSSEVDFYFES